MRVLVTRPVGEGERLAQLLRERGHEPILSPALDVHFADGPELSLDGAQAIVATSANAVRALAGRTEEREIPVFAVGPQTTEAARTAGFAMVRGANGDSRALAQKVSQWTPPGAGKLFYAAGDASTDDLVNALSQQGFYVEVMRFYRATERATLSDAAATGLRSENIDAVMLYSPRSARVFLQQVVRAGLQKQCGKIIALCISRAVAEALRLLPFADIRIAAQPNRDAMLDLLG
jgi:uroporphyrinogen-III synthase